MKITILQQNEYPTDEWEGCQKNHLTFISNSSKGYLTTWGSFETIPESRLKEKLEDGVITTFRYDYDDKTNT